MRSLVYMYYTHSSYRTSIFGKNRVYYIQIFKLYLIATTFKYHQ